jgi:hypothetical protein
MENLVEILINGGNPVLNLSDVFLSSFLNGGELQAAGSGVTAAFAAGAAPAGGGMRNLRRMCGKWNFIGGKSNGCGRTEREQTVTKQ